MCSSKKNQIPERRNCQCQVCFTPDATLHCIPGQGQLAWCVVCDMSLFHCAQRPTCQQPDASPFTTRSYRFNKLRFKLPPGHQLTVQFNVHILPSKLRQCNWRKGRKSLVMYHSAAPLLHRLFSQIHIQPRVPQRPEAATQRGNL